jgi:peptide/nickel transport system substrate-binding protein
MSLAPVAAAAAPSRPPDELAIGITQFPATLNPDIEVMVSKAYVLGMVHRPITTYDANWHLVCMLCTELPSLDNGRAERIDLPDGKHGVRLTYTLRPDARWGDGVPVSTQDILFTYEVGRNPQSGVAGGELYRRIVNITAKDDKTFTLDIDRLTFDYADISDFGVLPAHLERAAFGDPIQYRNRTLYDTDPTNPGLYCGPYLVTEVSLGSHLVLERNPHWWGPKPYFRHIEIWTTENTPALQANLLSGGIDMIAGEIGLSLSQAIAFEKRHGNAFAIVYKPSLIYEHVDLNADNPLLADKRVHQAMLYAIDRKAISDKLFDGRDPVADSFVPPLDWIYDRDVPRYAYDPAKARALLDDAGWHTDGPSIRRNASGDALSLTLATTAGDRTRELVEEVLQSQWRQVGIDIRLKNQPARILFAETVTKRKFDMAMYAWSSAPENVPRSMLDSAEIPAATNGWSGENYTGFKNAEADRLIDAIEVELDRDRRRDLWYRIQALYAEDLPALPLYFRAEAFILPKWLAGLTPTGHQYPSTLGVENWHRQSGGEATQ